MSVKIADGKQRYTSMHNMSSIVYQSVTFVLMSVLQMGNKYWSS